MVGKSTVGRSFTGRSRKEMMPKRRTADMTRVVMTGLLMNISAMFISVPLGLGFLGGGSLDVDRRAGDQQELAVGDHCLAGLHTR